MSLVRCVVCGKEDEGGIGVWACHADLDTTPVHTGECFKTYQSRKIVVKRAQYNIGSYHWAGLSKLIEETGEVQQVVGKLIGTAGHHTHWDGSNLPDRLEEELADLSAAIKFVVEKNGLDEEKIVKRAEEKLATFNRWHDTQKDS